MAKRIAVSSLTSPDHEGWITKQGGSWKSWHRRWLVLHQANLYYFKTKKDQDVTGVIALTAQSSIRRDEKNKKSKYTFTVSNSKGDKGRVFFMYPDTEKEMQDWMRALENAVKKLNGGGGGSGGGSTAVSVPSTGTGSSYVPSAGNERPPAGISNTPTEQGNQSSSDHLEGVRAKLDAAKNGVDWLHAEDSKVLEFWQIWAESIPVQEEITDSGAIVFDVVVSADMEKISWRSYGPQNIYIQKMVDFFWNVGAPETEIDRLNDVGALINPLQIGSWIDMSAKGGMDGGWFFPVDVPLKFALEACDQGDSSQKVADWVERHGMHCCCVGRDMGAAPPRQTELKFFLSGSTLNEQLTKALDAYSEFNFPALPTEAVNMIKKIDVPGLLMSVITSSEGFVRMGLLVPHPPASVISELCTMSSMSGTTSSTKLLNFQKLLGSDGPEYVEFQYLVPGFGYGVYKEGYDVVLHFKAGEEVRTN